MDFEEESTSTRPRVARVPIKLVEAWRLAGQFGLHSEYLAELVDEDPDLTPAEVEALRADAIAKAKFLQQTRHPRLKINHSVGNIPPPVRAS